MPCEARESCESIEGETHEGRHATAKPLKHVSYGRRTWPGDAGMEAAHSQWGKASTELREAGQPAELQKVLRKIGRSHEADHTGLGKRRNVLQSDKG